MPIHRPNSREAVLARIAARVNHREKRSREDSINHAREQGEDLLRLKRIAGYGGWLEYAEANLRIGKSQRCVYVAFCERFPVTGNPEEEWAYLQHLQGNAPASSEEKEPGEKTEPKKPKPKADWRMCWGGLFDEAQTGDMESLLDRILTHTEAVEVAGRTIVSSENVEAWLRSPGMPDDRGDVSLLVCSKVIRTHDGAIRHIPMMDFRCEPSETSLQLVTSSMRRLGQKRGAILESGRSYHYYGFELLDEASWREFMYRSLLLTPFADPRYIGHRLLAGTARLRVTGSRNKPVSPRVVSLLV